MKSNVATDRDNAIFADAKLGRDDRAGDFDGQIWPQEKVWFAQVVRRVWPVKGAMALVQYSGCPERTARNYTTAHSEPPASVLRDLLRGGEGDRVLIALLGDQPPAWFCEIQIALKLKEAIDSVK
jgi:hypothetical protein